MPQSGQDRLYFEYSPGDFEVRRLAFSSLQFTKPPGFTGVFSWPLFQKWYHAQECWGRSCEIWCQPEEAGFFSI